MARQRGGRWQSELGGVVALTDQELIIREASGAGLAPDVTVPRNAPVMLDMTGFKPMPARAETPDGITWPFLPYTPMNIVWPNPYLARGEVTACPYLLTASALNTVDWDAKTVTPIELSITPGGAWREAVFLGST